MDISAAYRTITACLAVVLCANLASAQSADLPVISQAALVHAYTDATGHAPPPNTTLEFKNKKDPKGAKARTTTVKQPNGSYAVTMKFYGPNLANDFGLGPMGDPGQGGGILIGVICHELQHECIGENGGGSGEDPEDAYSCEHIAITYGSVMAACGEAASLYADATAGGGMDMGLLDKVRGLCMYIDKKRHDYNTEEGAEAAKNCYCDGTWIPPTACPDIQLPPLPPGSSCATGYPNNQILPACATCENLPL